MGEVFGETYASAYDAMYVGKDYESECDLLESAFDQFTDDEISSILDLGCGTGNHSLRLAERGYDVEGVDISPEMLSEASNKARAMGISPAFTQGDVRDVRLDKRFDAVILMFAVIGYQLTNEDLDATLATAASHLRPGGLLIFDAWYGPGVIVSPPGDGSRVIETADGPLQRKVSGSLDVRRHRATVRYDLSVNGHETTEVHEIRYLFPMEIERLLATSGFEMLALTPSGALDGEPTSETWNVGVVARLLGD